MAARPPDLSGINLNALLTLDAVLASRSIGTAAEQLGLTSSAVSHTLRHLREVLGDPLLVRAGNAMRPTPRAEALQGRLRRGLLELQAAIREPADFDPTASDRPIRLAADDVVAIGPLPRLLRTLAERGPRMDLELSALDFATVHADLEAGQLDLALMPRLPVRPGLRSQRSFRTDFAVLAWRGHPDLGDTIDLDQYCALPHAVLSFATPGQGIVDAQLELRGRHRRVAVRFPYFLAAPAVLEGTRLLMTCPRVAAEVFARRHPLRLLEPPLELPTESISVVWHERFDRDPAVVWLRRLVLDACAQPWATPSA